MHADRYLTEGSCDLKGIISSYATVDFVKQMLPSKKQGDLKSVSYDSDTRKLNLELQQKRVMTCREQVKEKSSILTCSFIGDDLPLGLNKLSFRVNRTKDGERCIEDISSMGAANNWVRAILQSPEGVNRQIATSILKPYRGIAGPGGKGKTH